MHGRGVGEGMTIVENQGIISEEDFHNLEES
jgi:hypothetical protein